MLMLLMLMLMLMTGNHSLIVFENNLQQQS
jgi:hypothetical protein